MKNPFTLLIVEDCNEHFGDFEVMLSEIREKLPIPINMFRAVDLHDAIDLIDKVNTVITDLFFPSKTGMDEEPSGIKVVELCLEREKPVVVITSTYHHGRKTEEHNKWCREHGLEMFDSTPEEGEVEAAHKPWLQALYGVIALSLGMESDEFKIEDGKIWMKVSFRNAWAVDGSHLKYLAYDLASPRNPVKLKMLQMGFARIHEE